MCRVLLGRLARWCPRRARKRCRMDLCAREAPAYSDLHHLCVALLETPEVWAKTSGSYLGPGFGYCDSSQGRVLVTVPECMTLSLPGGPRVQPHCQPRRGPRSTASCCNRAGPQTQALSGQSP